MTANKHPARVHVIIAREANSAIVIRRGPSKVSCTMGWDLRTNTFTMGQWLKGRIYERRCDLSPDGKHFIYFAFNGRFFPPANGSWTGISKTPYLKNLGFWGNGSAWGGGGLFINNSTYWINDFMGFHSAIRLPNGFKEQIEHPFHESYGGECPGVYYIRLQRDGWTLKHRAEQGSEDQIFVFEKPLWGGWVLEKTAHASTLHPDGKGCYYDTHRLIHEDGKQTMDLPEWEWGEPHKKRLYCVINGVLNECILTPSGLGLVSQIQDFNDMAFEAIKAPY